MTRHTDCHAGQQQQPGLAQRAARNKRRQGFANIRSGGPLIHQQAFTRCLLCLAVPFHFVLPYLTQHSNRTLFGRSTPRIL